MYKSWERRKVYKSPYQITAIFELTIFSVFNLASISLIFLIFGNTSKSGLPAIVLNEFFIIGCLVIIFCVHYFLIGFKGRYKEIIKYFDNKEKNELRNINVIYWFYYILTFLSLPSLGYILSKIK